ncbi:MAG: SusC/RagA family TonB-linked outer membrane protein [Niastella sp.]|nr:SusC/RagA family TonB-linked outer membrane protein [Niastella sp.]
MQLSTTTDQQRLYVSSATRYLYNRWQQGALIIWAFLFSLGVQARNGELPQDITLSFKEATLDKVFKEIRKQTGYSFVYTESEISRANKVTIQVSNTSLDKVLSICFQDQPLTYTIVDKIVVVKPRQDKSLAVPVVNNIAAVNPKKISMRGRVMNEKGDPLPGATVIVRRTEMSTTTDGEGYFSLSEIEEDAVLVVSSVGHVTQQMKIKALNMEIRLPIAVKEEEEVVVAYNKISSRSNTGAVTVVKGEQIATLPNRSFDKSLQGLVPGLLVTSGTGQPGGGLSNFVLRGIATGPSDNTLSGYSTVRNPLIVIDGIPVFQDAQLPEGRGQGLWDVPVNNPMATLNTSDIETVSILKDAAAIALYGSTASNGVVLITTKKGKVGKAVISIRSQMDIANRIKNNIDLVTQDEYMQLLYETYRNSFPGITDADILTDLKSKFPLRSDGSFYPFTDLTPSLYKKNATTFSNEVSISGGNVNSNYYLNFEWTKQDGVYRKTGFDRKSVRFNFENRVTNWLKVGMNTGLSYNIQDFAYDRAAQYGSIFYAYPLNPVYLENGEYYYNYVVPAYGVNPVASLNLNSSRNTSYRGLTKLFAELTLSKDIKFTSNLGVDFLLTEAKDKMDPRIFDRELNKTGVGRIHQGNIRTTNLINTNILSFTKAFGDHGLNVLAGQEARISTKQTITATGTYLQFYTNDQIDQTAIRTSSGNKRKETGLSYFGQANYDFRKKYFVSTSIRSDGYSQFGGKQPFNTFWSLGGGWIISAEKFMESTQSWLNYLKLRGSMGPAGNATTINRYIKYQQLTTLNYLDNSTLGLLPGATPPNSLIAPEKTFTWNAGLELQLWQNRIAVTADFYRRKTTNLIYFIDLPYASGFSNVQNNLGDIVNKGTELSINANIIKSKNFSWNLNANWSTNQNKLIKANSRLPVTVNGTDGLANQEGRNFNSFYMRVWAGVDPATGAGMWIDSTGKPNTDFNAAKPQWVGKPQPDGFGAITNTFNYNGISFSFQLYYQYGFKVYNADPKLTNDGYTPFDNQQKSALNRWQKLGDMAANPKREMYNAVYNQTSTRNLFDGDYIRLQTVSIGYEVPKKLIQPLNLNSIRIYAQGYNLALWSTKRPGTADVSNVNVQGLLLFQYPQAQSYSIGINASF